jgi:hypothetical protein
MGNLVEWVNDKNNIMVVIPAECVALDFDKEGNLDSYLVNRESDMKATGSIARFDKEEIFHQRRPNPASLLWGLSPFIANRKSVLTNRYTSDYINSFYLRGATPSMVLSLDRNMSEDVALRFLRSFEVANTGRRNNRRTLILPKGVSAESFTPSMADQQILEISKETQNKILAVLKIPKHAFSLAESGSLGSEEHKQALRFFYKSAVIPAQNKRAGYLTMRFRERGVLEPNQYICFDNSSIDFLQDDMLSKAELGNSLKGQWTLNEIRSEIWDKPPVENGDEVEGSQPFQPSFFSAPDDAEERQDEDDAEERQDAETIEVSKEIKDKRLANKQALMSKYKDIVVANEKELDKEVERKENSILEIILDLFAKQFKQVILPEVEAELDQAPAREKAASNPKKIPAKLRSKVLTKRLNKKLKQFLEDNDIYKTYADKLDSTVTRSYGTMVLPTFEADRIAAIEAMQQEGTKKRRQTLEARGIKSFDRINATTTEKVMKVIERGIEKRKTIIEISEDIGEKVKDFAGYRAERIARTEVLTAVSLGKAAAMEDMQEVFEDEPLVKVWLSAGDDRVRDSHVELDGEAIPVDETFDNGLDFPRDPSGEAGEVINCRCDVLAIPKQDLGKLEIKPSEF